MSSEQLPATIPDHTSIPTISDTVSDIDTPRTPCDPAAVAAATATPRPSVAPMSIEPDFFDEDQLRHYYQNLKNNYQDLVQYVHQGRNEHVKRRDQLLTGIRTITDTLPFIPPIQRAQLEPVIFSQQQEALAVDQHIAELDQQLQIDRQAMAYEFNTAYNQHPEHFYSLLADTKWPTPEVCQDLQLEPTLLTFVRNALSPNTNTINETTNQQIHEMHQRILELEASLTKNRLQSSRQPTTATAQIEESQEINNTPRLLPTIYERRRRTKIPTFSNGDPSTAQHWLEKYIHICEYLQFTPEDQLEELNVALDGPAIKWFSTLQPDQQNNFDQFKSIFLMHFGGGTQPSRNALADLKKLRQNTTPMSKFAPEITDLLICAEIYSDSLQLDFFCDRVHPKLQEAIYMRGATTLQEAIEICNEVEYNLSRAGLKLQPYSAIPHGTTQTSTTTEHTPTPDYNTTTTRNAQHYQHKKKFNDSRNNAKSNAQTTAPPVDDDWIDIFQHMLSQTNSQNICNQQNENNNNALRFHVPVKYKTHQQSSKALIDTGSTLSSIRRHLVKELSMETTPCRPTIIHYGNNSTQLTTEAVTLQITINNIDTTCTLYVVEKQNENIILGMDWMTLEDIGLRPKNCTIFKIDEQNSATHEDIAQQLLQKYPQLTDYGTIQPTISLPYEHPIDTEDHAPVVSKDY
ncbi:hypothetical protein INT45_002995 [Circinella minor]|uniref:Ty3 transposon capsid-like protein domain-containing protein n=1 Tax=Circinella minor TaxID=1195481 RepID=A0A8H7VG16_9FUNG|nr:hypothetical protein INT45_002995 [Circinella minor]